MIKVSHLKRFYRVQEKSPGLWGSVKSFFQRQYRDIKAVDDISFEVKAGELVGFIGPNGAGKTTTLKCLSGLLYPTAGKVSVLGFNPYERKSEFLRQIALVMGQKNQLWWDLPPVETFLLNKEIYQISDAKYIKNLNELTELLEIKDILKIQVRKLSLGQRMKCELAASLLHSPKVLFLDEPTIGLDVIMQKKMRDFIKTYNQRHQAAIILTSHYMNDVKELCKRVVIIDKGKIVFDDELAKIVGKYSNHKILKIILEAEVDYQKLVKVGEIKKYQFPEVFISVPRERVPSAVAEIIKSFPIVDLTIEEASIEEIIRNLFIGKKYF